MSKSLSRRSLVSVVPVGAVLALVGTLGCGGGGGGGGGGADTTVRGVVLAPGGSLTDEAAVEVLAPVVGANVFVVEVDDDGLPTGPALVSTTTDVDGRFAFPRPAGGFHERRVVQATMEGSPQAVGVPGAPRLHAPFADAPLVVDPVSEVVVRHLLEDPSLDVVGTTAVAAGTRLAAFTVAEVRSYLHLLQALASGGEATSLLIQTTIEATVDAINTHLSPSSREWLRAYSTPGEFEAPPAFDGTFHLIGHGSGLEHTKIRLSHVTATLSITGRNATVQFTDTVVEQNEACGAGPSPCGRTFTTSSRGLSGTESGTLVLGVGYVAILVLRASAPEWPFVRTTVASGFLTQDGQVLCLTIHAGESTDLLMGVRSAPSVGASHVNGTWWLGEHRRSVPASVTQTTQWNGPTSVSAAAALTFGAPTVVSNDTTWSVHTLFSCTPQPMTMFCAASGSIVAQSHNGGTGAGGTGYQIQGGRLTVDGLVGCVAPGARIFVMSESFPADRELGFGVAIKEGSGLDASILTGAYSMVGIEDGMGGNTLSHRINVGTLTFNGSGGGSVSGTTKGPQRRTCASNVACPAVGVEVVANGYSQPFTYSVGATGAVTVDLGGTFLSGQVTPDGFLLALLEARTEADEAVRTVLVAGKR